MSDVLIANALKAWRFLYRRGFIEGFGHLSVRLPGADRFLVLRHSAAMAATPEDFLTFDLDGNPTGGTVTQIDTWSLGLFKKSPYPELGKGLIEHFLQPANYDKIVQSTGGRWVPVYKRLFDRPFIEIAETGVPVSYAGAPTPAAGEVLCTGLPRPAGRRHRSVAQPRQASSVLRPRPPWGI